MTQQAMCFDTFIRICQCPSLPNLKVPELPELPSLSTTITNVLPEIKPNIEEADTYQDDDGTANVKIIIVCVIAAIFGIISMVIVVGLIYTKCIKKSDDHTIPQPNNSPNET
ncbi:uncharacterized protein LOC117107742 [Anneissia japonica]|uniref:uncharacterized protein LOC117107742 n=1 Tax=Anneissia japonica TaxID=1529436 RepID=UPI00142566AE|nr:uncharacterized protein LOC117107742 [Anneissia japonica]